MTSEESFARLDAIRAEKYPHEERDREEWRANADNPKKRAEISRRRSDWIEAQDRRENEAINALIPRVGLPCTVYYYTDRHAATITKILSPSKVVVQDNLVRRTAFASCYITKVTTSILISDWYDKSICNQRRICGNSTC